MGTIMMQYVMNWMNAGMFNLNGSYCKSAIVCMICRYAGVEEYFVVPLIYDLG